MWASGVKPTLDVLPAQAIGTRTAGAWANKWLALPVIQELRKTMMMSQSDYDH